MNEIQDTVKLLEKYSTKSEAEFLSLLKNNRDQLVLLLGEGPHKEIKRLDNMINQMETMILDRVGS